MKTTIVSVRLTPKELEMLDRLHKRAFYRNYWYCHGRSTILRYGLRVLDSLSDECFDNIIDYGGHATMNELKVENKS